MRHGLELPVAIDGSVRPQIGDYFELIIQDGNVAGAVSFLWPSIAKVRNKDVLPVKVNVSGIAPGHVHGINVSSV